VEERGVRLIRLWFTDVVGQLKSFAISPAELENALEEGMTIDGSSIDGFSRVQESDVLALPDPNSFELLPWVDPHAPEARMFCDIANLDGTPFEGEENAFHDPGDPYKLSKSAKGFIAGLLRHAPEITAITNQTVNSYKRLIPGFEAPVYVSWARNNRSALVRVPIAKNKASSTRIEYRAPDPACNPYLAFAVILAAGLRGIEEGYDLPSEASTNIFELTDEERAAEGLDALPQSLSEALAVMERSELVAEVLGEHIFEWFLRNKRKEWMGYKAQVTPFELDRYLRML
jgi:glutamine synthetase